MTTNRNAVWLPCLPIYAPVGVVTFTFKDLSSTAAAMLITNKNLNHTMAVALLAQRTG